MMGDKFRRRTAQSGREYVLVVALRYQAKIPSIIPWSNIYDSFNFSVVSCTNSLTATNSILEPIVSYGKFCLWLYAFNAEVISQSSFTVQLDFPMIVPTFFKSISMSDKEEACLSLG